MDIPDARCNTKANKERNHARDGLIRHRRYHKKYDLVPSKNET